MLSDLRLLVPAALDGGRLDRVLMALLPTVPRAALLDAFARGRVRCGDTVARKGRTVRAGIEVAIERLAERHDWRARPCPGPLALIASDAALIAVSKPGAQSCHPLHPEETGTLLNALLAEYPDLAAVGDDPLAPALVHRIDGGTSGLVLAARTARSYGRLREAFARQQVTKRYLALVEGHVDRPGGVVGHLMHSPDARGVMRPVAPHAVPRGERALRAETYYRPLRRVGRDTLLEITIPTGVTHQIRCQLAGIGHPVAGDTRYGAHSRLEGQGAARNPVAPERFFLHASEIRLLHPDTGRPLVLEAPLAPDLARHLERHDADENR